MMGPTRQFRPRGGERAPDGEKNPAAAAGTKRRVLGDVSNRREQEEAPINQKRSNANQSVALVATRGRQVRQNDRAQAETSKPETKTQRSKSRSSRARENKPEARITRSSKKRDETSSDDGSQLRPRLSESKEVDTKASSRSRSQAKRTGKRSSDTFDSEPVAKRARTVKSSDERPKKTKTKKIVTSAGSDSVDARVRGRSKSKGTKGHSKSTTRALCSDFLTDSNFSLVREPFDSSKYTAGIAEFDKPNQEDTLEAAEYVTDIYQRLYHAEITYQPDMYMKNQENINEMMRAILIDWLVEVHMKFKLYPNTLYLCVNIVDRYCSMVEVQRPKLQLVGVAALLLACKYEEIYPPEVRDCVYITDRAYTRQELLDMEQNIVEKLDFKLTVPTGHPFLVRYLLVVQASELAKAAANYYMERTLQEYEFLQYRPSLVAAAAVCLALNNPQIRSKDNAEGPKPGIPDVLLQYTGYSKDAIFEVAERIVENIGVEPVSASQRPLVSVKKKFAHRNFFSVSNQIIDPEIDDLLAI